MQALQLTILVGTMTGTAQLVAQEIELTVEDPGIQVRTLPMDGLDATVFAAGGLFLICSSTYGQGDVPDNAKRLYESLGTVRPDLSRVYYGVIALGELMLHDASAGTMPEELAVRWASEWLSSCRNEVTLANRA
jgi:MioC protein